MSNTCVVDGDLRNAQVCKHLRTCINQMRKAQQAQSPRQLPFGACQLCTTFHAYWPDEERLELDCSKGRLLFVHARAQMQSPMFIAMQIALPVDVNHSRRRLVAVSCVTSCSCALKAGCEAWFHSWRQLLELWRHSQLW